jgi:hypothetical protein
VTAKSGRRKETIAKRLSSSQGDAKRRPQNQGSQARPQNKNRQVKAFRRWSQSPPGDGLKAASRRLIYWLGLLSAIQRKASRRHVETRLGSLFKILSKIIDIDFLVKLLRNSFYAHMRLVFFAFSA